MPSFHVRADAIQGFQVRLDREESHHIRRVYRLGPGDVVELFDGAGHHYQVRLEAVTPEGMEGTVLRSSRSVAESRLACILVQAVPKGEKMEWVIQKATELGVTRIVPLLTARTVVHLSPPRANHKLRRWQRVAKEAAKQARRGVVPEIAPPASLADFLGAVPSVDLALCLWEGAEEPVAVVLDRAGAVVNRALLLVGPEGGWAREEMAEIQARGITAAGLGPRILRTESAALVGLALLQFRFGDLGGRM